MGLGHVTTGTQWSYDITGLVCGGTGSQLANRSDGWSLTSSRCIAHYGMTGNVSLPAASATDGQALHHSWTHRTLLCGANARNSTAGLLIVKWIQLLLVFSWGFQPPQRVINRDPAF